ncbi:Hypothetical predicted protein [Lecanosticta acicola]|uniref:Uncharacterized protein n=1 Tax=Lecanosticta acicola TaxID=111012 RepID=A0AAI8Z582_9PEZI|nr:Hypothetical predicted protein [Lecanosticta acicola]
MPSLPTDPEDVDPVPHTYRTPSPTNSDDELPYSLTHRRRPGRAPTASGSASSAGQGDSTQRPGTPSFTPREPYRPSRVTRADIQRWKTQRWRLRCRQRQWACLAVILLALSFLVSGLVGGLCATGIICNKTEKGDKHDGLPRMQEEIAIGLATHLEELTDLSLIQADLHTVPLAMYTAASRLDLIHLQVCPWPDDTLGPIEAEIYPFDQISCDALEAMIKGIGSAEKELESFSQVIAAEFETDLGLLSDLKKHVQPVLPPVTDLGTNKATTFTQEQINTIMAISNLINSTLQTRVSTWSKLAVDSQHVQDSIQSLQQQGRRTQVLVQSQYYRLDTFCSGRSRKGNWNEWLTSFLPYFGRATRRKLAYCAATRRQYDKVIHAVDLTTQQIQINDRVFGLVRKIFKQVGYFWTHMDIGRDAAQRERFKTRVREGEVLGHAEAHSIVVWTEQELNYGFRKSKSIAGELVKSKKELQGELRSLGAKMEDFALSIEKDGNTR